MEKIPETEIGVFSVTDEQARKLKYGGGVSFNDQS